MSASHVPRLSVVVPLYNEEENVPHLVRAVEDALGPGDDWELLLIDEGSRDTTVAVATGIARTDPRVRVLCLARNYGQTMAMQAGFDHARGGIVVSMDGDLQNDPQDIPGLVARLEEGYDLVAGYRERRQDTMLTRKVPSWVANRIIRALTGVPIRDNGCSLKAYRREVLERVHLYSEMHRFIPAVAAAIAGARIAELPVRHHARRFGQSKYGLSRVAKVLADLLTIKMIRSFRETPLSLFAIGSLAAGLIGVAFAVRAVLTAIFYRPEMANAVIFPAVSLLAFGLSSYLLLLGLIAETAVQSHRRESADPVPLARGDLR